MEILLALDLSLNKQRVTLVNIYRSSDRDTPGFFFQQLESIFEKLGNASSYNKWGLEFNFR